MRPGGCTSSSPRSPRRSKPWNANSAPDCWNAVPNGSPSPTPERPCCRGPAQRSTRPRPRATPWTRSAAGSGAVSPSGRCSRCRPSTSPRCWAASTPNTPRWRCACVSSPTGSVGLATALRAGELDVAFLLLPGGPTPGIAARDLLSVRLVAVVRADHPLAGAGEVTLAELAAEPFIDFPVGYGNRTVADRAFAGAGLERQVALEVTEITTGAQYVRHGFGVTLLPDFAAPTDPDLRTLTVSDHPLTWTLSVATAATRRPGAAVRALLGMVDAFVTMPGSGE
ncbi:LysR substrate-binding domain-containing protein [Yinghuangia aomiensis]